MSLKPTTVFGIEFDNLGIRAARVNHMEINGAPARILVKFEELRGNFASEQSLKAGLKSMREKMGISAKSRVATSVSGKQVYAVQIPFRSLPETEMKNALKLEIRKSLPFDVSDSTVEYQVLEKSDKKADEQQVLVTAVANALITGHLQTLGGAGIRPSVVDTLPTVVGNAFHEAADDIPKGQAMAVMHIGPGMCTLVIDGAGAPFFQRNIYFSADEIYGETQAKGPLSERERVRRLAGLGDEIARSLSFYEKTYAAPSINGFFLLGEYLDKTEIFEAIREKTGLAAKPLDVAARIEGTMQPPAGKFDVAITLALRI
jgi:Tfp pilus assembly PilM family ATPase